MAQSHQTVTQIVTFENIEVPDELGIKQPFRARFRIRAGWNIHFEGAFGYKRVGTAILSALVASRQARVAISSLVRPCISGCSYSCGRVAAAEAEVAKLDTVVRIYGTQGVPVPKQSS